MKKTICVLLMLTALMLTGCNKPGYEQTAATEKAINVYTDAVKASIAEKGGTIDITIRCDDEVVSKKDTTEHYVYTYTVEGENDERFDYRCYDSKEKLINHMATVEENGTVKVVNQLTKEDASNFSGYLNHSKNPISTLQLFRMDSDYTLQHSTISSIVMEEKEGAQIITVTFHGDKLTDMSIKNESGLVRKITSHQRIYTVKEGKIARIEIHDEEKVQYGTDTGMMNTDTVVEVNYQ